MKKSSEKLSGGFTLIEVLIVIAILVLIAGIVIVSINPARQFSQARDAQRLVDVSSILNSIGQNIIENKGIFMCEGQEKVISDEVKTIKSPEDADGIDLYDCLVPKYLVEMPVDPKDGSLPDSGGNYNTLYTIEKVEEGRIKISATAEIAENSPISVTR